MLSEKIYPMSRHAAEQAKLLIEEGWSYAAIAKLLHVTEQQVADLAAGRIYPDVVPARQRNLLTRRRR